MVAIVVARAYDVISLNDPLTRSLLFLPLFTRFLMNAHRQTLKDTANNMSVTKALAWGPLTYLGPPRPIPCYSRKLSTITAGPLSSHQHIIKWYPIPFYSHGTVRIHLTPPPSAGRRHDELLLSLCVLK